MFNKTILKAALSQAKELDDFDEFTPNEVYLTRVYNYVGIVTNAGLYWYFDLFIKYFFLFFVFFYMYRAYKTQQYIDRKFK